MRESHESPVIEREQITKAFCNSGNSEPDSKQIEWDISYLEKILLTVITSCGLECFREPKIAKHYTQSKPSDVFQIKK
jgi:hypothetical protein